MSIKNPLMLEIEERVLCFHGPVIYEAKVLDIQQMDNEFKYFVHYFGWNKNWDEWVPKHRILYLNQQNLNLQKELNLKFLKPKKNKSYKKVKNDSKEWNESVVKTVDKSVNNGNNGRTVETISQSVPEYVETEESFLSKVEIKIKIPEKLSLFLFNDWELITKQKKLFELPAKVSIDSIVDNYLKYKMSTKHMPNKENIIIEFVDEIKQYFEAMIGCQLLFRFERNQYQKLFNQINGTGITMTSIYGFIHLLRLFTKFGHFLAFTQLNDISIQLVVTQINDFLKWLAKNEKLFSLNDYSIVNSE